MALSENNRKYFSIESDKNRDQWTHGDGEAERILRIKNMGKINPYATMKFDDVIHYKAPTRLWTNADGEEEFEDEESVEPEGEDAMVEEEFVDEELPKFRQLVRAKKMELKAQYGKAHVGTKPKVIQVPATCYKTVSVPYPCPTFREPLKTCYKNSNVPYPCTKDQTIQVPTWVWGWRKKWREFKQSGGLAKLKMVSKGMADISTVLGSSNLPPQIPSDFSNPTPNKPGRFGSLKEGEDASLDPKLDLGNGTSEASLTGNIVGTVLVLGLVFAAIKMMK